MTRNIARTVVGFSLYLQSQSHVVCPAAVLIFTALQSTFFTAISLIG